MHMTAPCMCMCMSVVGGQTIAWSTHSRRCSLLGCVSRSAPGTLGAACRSEYGYAPAAKEAVGAWSAVTLYASFFCVRVTLRSPSISPARGFRTEVTPLPRLHVSSRISTRMMTVHSPGACTRASRGSQQQSTSSQSRRCITSPRFQNSDAPKACGASAAARNRYENASHDFGTGKRNRGS